ncbi:alpha/beta fold hydrolase [Nocardia crassostreae]|uniref:alpha/beta fold hydrolase n=1 Tax=Nocardia crassostreae TaxID=53428 RepID=UPI0008347F44|nr:alpha/beta hydrolase [Nocardia crassostreae]
MSERTAVGVGPARVDIAYEMVGDPGDPALLLVMGAGAQLVHWPDGFCAELVGRGFRVIRFDNRDAGHSTHLVNAPEPDIMAAIGCDVSSTAYTLSDMAADAVGLLDALGVDSAHVVGLSQGGMIAQTLAAEHPARARSLTSISSTTGNPGVGQAAPGAFGAGGPPPQDRDGYIAWRVGVTRALASPGFVFDEAAVAATAARAYDRDHDFASMMRQMIAVLATGDRTAQLHTVHAPTLVIHGTDDPIIDVSGGRATAAAIPGAELVVVDGLGHSLPRELWPEFADRIGELARRADTAAHH